MPDYSLVVRKGDKYLADPFHRRQWTLGLPWAKHYHDKKKASAAAEKTGGEVRLIEMKEVD